MKQDILIQLNFGTGVTEMTVNVHDCDAFARGSIWAIEGSREVIRQ